MRGWGFCSPRWAWWCGAGVGSRLVVGVLAAGSLAASSAGHLDGRERRLLREAGALAADQTALLEQLVGIPSPTGDSAGIEAVGELLRPRLEADGFSVGWRKTEGGASHLVADRPGSGQTVLLVAHLDTVFRQPFPWRREGDRVWGAGVSDDKGGLVVAWGAANALVQTGAVGDLHLVLYGSGDEEAPQDRSVLRGLAAEADLILGFEPGAGEDLGLMVTARRGFVSWDLVSSTNPGLPRHSSRSTRQGGYGAALECARVLDEFGRLPDMFQTLTLNVAFIGAGARAEPVPETKEYAVSGVRNTIPETCRAFGEIRGLREEEVVAAKSWMSSVTAAHTVGTSSALSLVDDHRPWPASDAQAPAMELLAEVHTDLGLPALHADDPMARGASDLNSLADLNKPMIDGWGIPGGKAHTMPNGSDLGEWADLAGMRRATERLAVFLKRMAEGGL